MIYVLNSIKLLLKFSCALGDIFLHIFSKNFIVAIICGCLQISDTSHFENAFQNLFSHMEENTHTHTLP